MDLTWLQVCTSIVYCERMNESIQQSWLLHSCLLCHDNIIRKLEHTPSAFWQLPQLTTSRIHIVLQISQLQCDRVRTNGFGALDSRHGPWRSRINQGGIDNDGRTCHVSCYSHALESSRNAIAKLDMIGTYQTHHQASWILNTPSWGCRGHAFVPQYPTGQESGKGHFVIQLFTINRVGQKT